MHGWNTTSDISKTIDSMSQSLLITLDSEPVFADIGEKVRELTVQLHDKIISQELKWSLMMTPLSMVNMLKDMCEQEITRREHEYRELGAKDKEL